jgi:hypothetical protein
MIKKIFDKINLNEANERYNWCPEIRPGATLRVNIVDNYLEEYMLKSEQTIEEEEEDTPVFIFIKNESSSR